jgi:uncharacterized membrane protein YhaH (DUF805 family)
MFGFSGRLNRAPYWKSILVAMAFIPAAVILVIPYIAIEHPEVSQQSQSMSPLGIATIAALCLLVLAYLVFAFAIMVKRMHDRNKSAWWIVPFFAIPEVLGLVIDPKLHPIDMPLGLRLALNLLVLALSLWAFVELGCLRGTVGDNRFGPDPLAQKG